MDMCSSLPTGALAGNSAGWPQRLPLTLISGYLGAGKTTLVNHLLRHAEGRRIAVLVNDFGDVNIDADLITGQDGNVVRLAGGCVCCQFGNDLVSSLQRLSSLVAPERPDELVLEASGIGLPSALVSAIALLPELRLAAVLVLADAETVQARAADRYVGDTVLQQLHSADLLILNKCDLLDATQHRAVRTWLGQQGLPGKVVEAVRSAVPVELLLGPFRPPSASGRPAPSDSSADILAGDAHLKLRPAMRPATDQFEQTVLTLRDHIDTELLVRTLADWPGLLRAKGFATDASGRVTLVQVVGVRTELSPSASPQVGSLLCIGVRGQLQPSALAARLAAMSLLVSLLVRTGR